MSRLEGRVVLVTGAGRGIGRAVAQLLGEHGAMLALTGRHAAELDALAEDIEKRGGTALAVPGDITDAGFVARLFATVREQFHRLDILINNASVVPFVPVADLPPQQLRYCLDASTAAASVCMRAAIALMRDTGGTGKILNLGSEGSLRADAGDCAAYNASNGGLRAMTEAVALQLRGTDLQITVGMLGPGAGECRLTYHQGLPDWSNPGSVARAVLHAILAPPAVSILGPALYPLARCPW